MRAGRLERARARRAPRDIESSTVTRCSCPPVRSFSVRPRVGRISASWPGTTWERLSLVETCTVRSARRIASSVTSVSGAAGDEVAAQPEEHLGLAVAQGPDRRRPCRGRARAAGRSRTPSASASRKCCGGRSQMPIVRSPCTLEWPRTGHSPAPGLPMLPCSSATLAISLIVATALRCWVMPIAQQMTVARGVAEHPRGLLDLRAGRARWPARRPTSRARARAPPTRRTRRCARSMKSWSTQPHSSSSEPIAWNSARSPLTRTGRCRSASSVPTPLTPRGRSAGCGSGRSPASWSGLIARIFAPFFLACSRAVSIRGWLVPGFWPMTTISSASWTSSQADAALADADRLGERDRGRLVAHVRAVRQVVGAEGADEQLVGERGLVGGAAGGVEDRLVGASPARCSRSRDQPERVVPGDRLVVRGAARAAPSAR